MAALSCLQKILRSVLTCVAIVVMPGCSPGKNDEAGIDLYQGPEKETHTSSRTTEFEDSHAADSVEYSLYQLLLKLLERDGNLVTFKEAESNLSAICIDWKKQKMHRDIALLHIEHYWIRYDEPIDEMKRIAKHDCTTWAEKNEGCECAILSIDGDVALEVPADVASRITRSKKAWELVRLASTREAYEETEHLRASGVLLSKSGKRPGYTALESMQEGVCKKGAFADHPACSFNPQTCRDLIYAQGKRLGYESDPQVLEIACSQLSTSFEMPGVFELLNGFHIELMLAAEIEGYQLSDAFAFGSMPTEKINVSITPEDVQGARIILFNTQFFSFVYEMIKVASLSVPFGETTEGILAISSSESELLTYLDENPEVESVFLETVFTFLGLANREPITPPTQIRPLLVTFGYGAEQFAMAHEMGHSFLKHSGEGSLNVGPELCGSPGNEGASWLEELEADYVSLRLMEQVALIKGACSGGLVDNQNGLVVVGQPLDHCESHPFEIGVPLAALSYFTAQSIRHDACSVMNSGEASEPHSEEIEILSFAKTCRLDPECDFLESVRKKLTPSLVQRRGYPHPKIRQALIRLNIRDQEMLSRENPVSTIGLDLIRNANAIWGRALSRLKDRKEGGI